MHQSFCTGQLCIAHLKPVDLQNNPLDKISDGSADQRSRNLVSLPHDPHSSERNIAKSKEYTKLLLDSQTVKPPKTGTLS